MNVTIATSSFTIWCVCADCGVEVELPDGDTAGFLLPCPDCPGSLEEVWRREADGRRDPRQPQVRHQERDAA